MQGSGWGDLVGILRKECVLCCRLLGLAGAERKQLVNHDFDSLATTVSLQQAVTQELVTLDRECRRLCMRLGGGNAAWEKIEAAAPSAVSGSLRVERLRLVETLAVLREVSRQNLGLLAEGVTALRQVLDVVHSLARPDPNEADLFEQANREPRPALLDRNV